MRPVVLFALALALLSPTALAAVEADTLTLAPGASKSVPIRLAKGDRLHWTYGVTEPRFYEAFLSIKGFQEGNVTYLYPPARENSRDGTFEAPFTGDYSLVFDNPNSRTIILNYRAEHNVPGEFAVPGPGLAALALALAVALAVRRTQTP